MFKKYMYIVVVLAVFLAACTPAATQEVMMEKPTEIMETPITGTMETPTTEIMETPTEVMMDKPTEEIMAQDATTTPEAMMDEKMMESPAWFSAMLTNVRTGENFSINDFKDKVVLVETLAMWCPSCKRQQIQVQALHDMQGTMGENLVSIGLDIDPNENASDLKAYTESNGFDWVYAVAPADVSREIGQLYGEKFLNPPSTPILVIDREGQVHLTPFGIKSAEELKMFIESFLNEDM